MRPHSPFFVDPAHYERLRRFRKRRGSRPYPTAEVTAARIAGVAERLRGIADERDVTRRLDITLRRTLSEAVFAQAVLEELGIATFTVFDADLGKAARMRVDGKREVDIEGATREAARWNRILLRLHGAREEDWPPTRVEATYAVVRRRVRPWAYRIPRRRSRPRFALRWPARPRRHNGCRGRPTVNTSGTGPARPPPGRMAAGQGDCRWRPDEWVHGRAGGFGCRTAPTAGRPPKINSALGGAGAAVPAGGPLVARATRDDTMVAHRAPAGA